MWPTLALGYVAHLRRCNKYVRLQCYAAVTQPRLRRASGKRSNLRRARARAPPLLSSQNLHGHQISYSSYLPRFNRVATKIRFPSRYFYPSRLVKFSKN